MKKTQLGGLIAIILVGIVLYGGLVSPSVIQLAPIHIVNVEVIVRDKDTSQPIKDVLVQFDLVKPPFEYKGDVDYSAITDSSGVARRSVAVGQYYLTLSKPNYKTLNTELLSLTGEYKFHLSFYMEKTEIPIKGHIATFYLRDVENKPVTRCTVFFEGKTYTPTIDGRVIIFDLESGTYNIRFKGTNFDFTTTFTMPNEDAKFTILIEQETIIDDPPPPPPTDPEDVWKWAWENIHLVGIGLVLIFAFVILFRGRGPELIGLK